MTVNLNNQKRLKSTIQNECFTDILLTMKEVLTDDLDNKLKNR